MSCARSLRGVIGISSVGFLVLMAAMKIFTMQYLTWRMCSTVPSSSRKLLQNQFLPGHSHPSVTSQPSVEMWGGRKENEDERFHQVSNGEMFLHAGFLDVRFAQPAVRFFGLRSRDMSKNLMCTYSDNSPPSYCKPYAIFPSWPSDKLKYLAYEFECEIPRSYVDHLTSSTHMDVGVSLGSTPNTDKMTVNIVGAATGKPRQTLAICVKAIWGPVNPVKLIEWIEFNKYLGVEKIVFYDVLTLGRAREVLEHYQRQGFVDVVKFSYTQKMSIVSQNDPERRKLYDDTMWLEQTFLVALNDCYYRYQDRFSNVLVLDIDEILIPSNNRSLLEIVKELHDVVPRASALSFQTAWHIQEFGEYTNASIDVPKYLHMQRYLHRTAVWKRSPKSIISTDRSFSINWHSSVRCPSELNGNEFVDWERFGFVHHYRGTCAPRFYIEECKKIRKELVVDTVLPLYKTPVGKVVSRMLKTILGGAV